MGAQTVFTLGALGSISAVRMAVPTRIGLSYSPPLLFVEFNAGGKLWHRRVTPEDVRKPEHAIYFAGVPELQLARFLGMLKAGAAVFESCGAGEWPADADLTLRSKGHAFAAVLARAAAATGRWEVFGRVCREADMSTLTKIGDGEGKLLRVMVDLAEQHDRDIVDLLDAKDLALLSLLADEGCLAAKSALAKKAAGCESVLRTRRSFRPENPEADAPSKELGRQATAEAAERLVLQLDPAGTIESVPTDIGEETGMDKAESEVSKEAPEKAQPDEFFQPPVRRSTTDAAERLAPKLGPAGMVESVLVEIGEDAGMDKAESKVSIEASAEAKWQLLMPDDTPRAREASPQSAGKGAARKPTLSPSSSTSSTDHSVNLSPAGSVQSVDIA
jgi:hypothetical protein